VTEADASIRSFLERRLGYKVKDTIAIQVSQICNCCFVLQSWPFK
jgi:hypothetical protein